MVFLDIEKKAQNCFFKQLKEISGSLNNVHEIFYLYFANERIGYFFTFIKGLLYTCVSFAFLFYCILFVIPTFHFEWMQIETYVKYPVYCLTK